MQVFGLAGWSGSGKTTLLVALVARLVKRGHRVSTVKHAHHAFDVDKPGKDSYELRKAGANTVLIASSKRWAKMVEREVEAEPVLEELLEQIDVQQVDMVLVEGFKNESFTKIEVHRQETQQPLLHKQDSSIIAIATDLQQDFAIPRLDINQPSDIVQFIKHYFTL